MMVSVKEIRALVQDLRLSGRPVCIHSSLRSFGWVVGGPNAVIEGLLAEGCTVMVPTFSDIFSVLPPQDMRPARNGWDYGLSRKPQPGAALVYMPDSVEIDREDMGAIPATIVTMPQRVRGNHPLNSFAAIGPLAQELISRQQPMEVYGPFKALAERDGFAVLMGVGLNRMTLLHLAEQIAGRNLFIRWANSPDRQPMMVEVGGCSEGFPNLMPTLVPLMREKPVGESVWRAFPADETLPAAASAIRQDPAITHCGDPQCGRCNDAILGGPIL